MKPEIFVQRRFPTYDFVVRTMFSPEHVRTILTGAMHEPDSDHWPFPKANLNGTVSEGTFKCRPRTSAFGGNAVPNVNGEIVPREDGGTDVLVRVTEWFIFIMGGFLLFVGSVILINGGNSGDLLKGIGGLAFLFLVLAGIYGSEASFVRGIFARPAQ